MFGMAGATVFGAGNGSVGGIDNVPDGLIISTITALGNFDNIAAGFIVNFGNIGELPLGTSESSQQQCNYDNPKADVSNNNNNNSWISSYLKYCLKGFFFAYCPDGLHRRSRTN